MANKPKEVEETFKSVHGFAEGDHVQLKDTDGGFTDRDTLFDISRDQVKPLTAPIGEQTTRAILTGNLLIVDAPKGGKKAKDEAEA